MKLDVRTCSFDKLILFVGLLSIILISICVLFAIFLHSFIPIYLILPLFMILVFLGHYLATKNSQISINEESIQIDELIIARKSFSTYFLNESGINMVTLELELKNGKIHEIEYKSFGENGKQFDHFIEELKRIKIENKSMPTESNYQGMFVEQVKSFLPFLSIVMALVVLFDLYWVYAQLTNSKSPVLHKLLFCNIYMIYFIPYILRLRDYGKSKFKNQQ